MKLYKLTDRSHCTRRSTWWGPGITNSAPGTGPLCTSGWIHAYESPLIAVVMDPVHAQFLPSGCLWEAEGEGTTLRSSGGLKCGVQTLTTVRIIDTPLISPQVRVRWAILGARAVNSPPGWRNWSEAWLSGDDRSFRAADTALDYLYYAKPVHADSQSRYSYTAVENATVSAKCLARGDNAEAAAHAAHAMELMSKSVDLDLLFLLNRAIAEEG